VKPIDRDTPQSVLAQLQLDIQHPLTVPPARELAPEGWRARSGCVAIGATVMNT